jgi:DNA-binding NarL/FixJ family response regulator
MAVADLLARGRESFSGRAWADACTHLNAADADRPLTVDDLERLATASYLTGRDDVSEDAWTRAHQECLAREDVPRAVRCAFWLAFGLMLRGEMARAGGWLSRAQRMLEDEPQECAEAGYLLIPAGLHGMGSGDPAGGHATFVRAAEIGHRVGDPDLTALGRLGQGQALIRLGQTTEGLTLMDEVMVSVTAGEISPVVSGIVYCAVIEACQSVFDLRRAQEWTAALTRWCGDQPDLVRYRGQCMVYRSEVKAHHGEWPDATEEALRACRRLEDPPGQPAVGMAFYRYAEMSRLTGHADTAREHYRLADQAGRSPQPGLALLLLTEGEVEAARTAVRHALTDAHDTVTRAGLLAAAVDITLAAGDTTTAEEHAADLTAIADGVGTPALRATAEHATACVLLAEGDCDAACAAFRRAATVWQEIQVPYEAARSRVMVGLATRRLGDQVSAVAELDSARRAFARLGAAPDVARVDELSARWATPERPRGGLTGREVEVLRLVASGRTNRDIAAELVLSEHTVARHVQNIFTKLGLRSRTAAAAYAYEHGLA